MSSCVYLKLDFKCIEIHVTIINRYRFSVSTTEYIARNSFALEILNGITRVRVGI